MNNWWNTGGLTSMRILSFAVLFVALGLKGSQAQCPSSFSVDISFISCDRILVTNTTTKATNDVYSVRWGGGNVTTLTSDTISYKYTNRQNRRITFYIVNNTINCSDSIVTRLVMPLRSNLILVENEVCKGDSLTVRADSRSTGLNSIDSIKLDFGDATKTSITSLPVRHSWSSSGIYNLTFCEFKTVRKSGVATACEEKHVRRIYAYDVPSIDIVHNPVTCRNRPEDFSYSSTFTSVNGDAVNSHLWDFGDGTGSTGANPSHAYSANGNYDITLMVETDSGHCAAHDTSTIEVKAAIDSFSVSGKCQSDSIEFTNNTGGVTKCGDIDRYTMFFGDGSFRTADNFIIWRHKYASAGTYKVSMVIHVSDSTTIYTDTFVRYIKIDPSPTALFSKADVCAPDSVAFIDSSSVGQGAIIRYEWEYGDGNSSSVNVERHRHGYSKPGKYEVQLVVTTDSGCTDTMRCDVNVFPSPQASFTCQDSCLGESTRFFDRSKIVGDSIVKYEYWFGGSDFSTLKNSNHEFLSAGQYPVRLVVTTSNGCTDTVLKKVNIYGVPNIQLSVDSLACRKVNQDFRSLTSGTYSYWWIMNNDTVGTSRNVSQTFQDTGQVEVLLVMQNQDGCKSDSSFTVNVLDQPNAMFSLIYDSSRCDPLKVQFDLRPRKNHHYLWHLGKDNDTFTEWNTLNRAPSTQSYEGAIDVEKRYSVELRDSNACGVSSQIQSFRVKPLPTAQIIAPEETRQCTPAKFSFANTSKGLPDSFFWYIDGILDTSQAAPQKSYTPDLLIYDELAPPYKDFEIKLVAKNECSHISEDYVVVRVESNDAVARFGFTGTGLVGCVPFSVEVADSSRNARTVNYEILKLGANGESEDLVGSVTSDTGATEPLFFDVAGTYFVKQVIKGCGDSRVEYRQTRSIVVIDTPEAIINNLPDLHCSGAPLLLVSDAKRLARTWEYQIEGRDSTWQFISILDTVTFNPENETSDTIKVYIRLSVVEQHEVNCEGNTIDSFRLLPILKAKISPDFFEACHPQAELFKNVSSAHTSYTWKLLNNADDLEFESSQLDSIFFEPTGNGASKEEWKLRLVISNESCLDSTEADISILPLPITSFTATPTNDGDGCYSSNNITVAFENNSRNGDIQYLWNFGDSIGTSAREVPEDYTYALTDAPTDNFKVTLTTFNKLGCSSTDSQFVVINKVPKGDLIFSPDPICEGDTLCIQSAKPSASIRYSIELANGDKAEILPSSISQQHCLPVPISRVNRYLKIQTIAELVENGCVDTITFFNDSIAKVFAKPLAKFSCTELESPIKHGFYEFESETDSMLAYNWHFGDSTLASGRLTYHRYSWLSTFDVMHKVTSQRGCTDSIIKSLVVQVQGLLVPTGMLIDYSNNEYTLFKPKGIGLKEYHIQVWSEWDGLLWESTLLDDSGRPTDFWDGINPRTGELVEEGVYKWTVKAIFNDETAWRGNNGDSASQPQIGTLTIIR